MTRKNLANFASLSRIGAAVALTVVPLLGLVSVKPVNAAGALCWDDGVPYAWYSSSSYKAVGALDTTLDGSGSIGCDDQVVDYAWNFGDGTTGTGAVVPHTYGVGTWDAVLTVTDEAGLQDSYTRTFTVKASNEAPVAGDDTVQTSQERAVTVDVSGNDNDPDGDALNYSVATQPANGAISGEMIWYGYPTLTYTPATGFYGTDSFTYQVDDGFGGVATATVTVTVDPILRAVDDYATTDQAQSVTVNVLGNDVYPAEESVTVSVDPVFGEKVTVNPDNTITYEPLANFTGKTLLTYHISSSLGTSSAYIRVTVNDVNVAPTAKDDSYTLQEDGSKTGNVLYNDLDLDFESLTASLVSGPSNGTLELSANGAFTYVPNSNWAGTDSFTYQASDGNGGFATATVTLTVAAVNDAPVASFTTATSGKRQVYVDASNSYDVEGGAITYSWKFGDGSTATGETAQHRYKKPGTYTITLITTDDQGAVTKITRQVKV